MTKHPASRFALIMTAEYIRDHVPAIGARIRFLSMIRPKGMRTPIRVTLPGETRHPKFLQSYAAESVVHGSSRELATGP